MLSLFKSSRLFVLPLLLAGLLSLSSCVHSAHDPVGYNVSGKIGPKRGSSCSKAIFALGIKFGDGTVEAAMRQGHVSQITTVDRVSKGWYPFFIKDCIVVTGY